MKITGFTPSDIFSFPMFEKDAAVSTTASHDVVNLQSLNMIDMDDTEANALLNETIGIISQDHFAALSVHGGLTESRVAELLSL
ncbi:MAG: hypothetical protein IJU65_03810 [Desulfovibrio sp.]|nr:hypothetical protein [Desulfovibrio sp.]